MKGRIVVIGILMILLFSSFAVGFGSGNASGKILKKISDRGVKGYTSHAVIRINNDTDFANQAASEGWPGNGTQNNPYIISGYDIDAHGAGDAIYIGNTTVYFVVENCYLHNASYHSYPYFDGDGIMLYHVKNGKISGNNITNNEMLGIWLNSSSSNTISSNNITNNNNDGIYLCYSSSNNIISGNNITNNSGYGIYLRSSSNNNISENNIMNNSGNGITLDSSSSNTITGNNITHHRHYGIDLSYSSSNNTISGNNITNNSWDGILLWESSSNNIISGNNITNNGYYGIWLNVHSHSNTVRGNNITNNLDGIDLSYSSSNTIYNNLISNNTEYGIYIYAGSYNLIYNNFFYYNNGSGDTYNSSHLQAKDTGSNNYWNTSGTPHGYGNYWHDWANNNDTNDNNNDGIVDWPYKIDGSAGAKDYYPLKNPQPIPEFSTGIWLFIVVLISLLGVIRFRKPGI